jgi:sulfoxide reductase heme-binding subunit YedZ
MVDPGEACYHHGVKSRPFRRAQSCLNNSERELMSIATTTIAPQAPSMMRKLQIWRDRRGRLSWLRVATLGLLLMPLGIALANADAILHGARPINDLIHRAGFWMLMFLLATLATTPLRRITRFGDLLDVRRMLGVGAFVYGVAHISLYTGDQMFDLGKVASEIVLRVYLLIGFTALVGLATLAATSTDGMVRRLGGMRWQRLHYVVYGIGVLALIHYFQQTKADVSVPTFTAGVFAWLIGYRIALKLKKTRGELSTMALVGLSFAVAGLTFLAEAIGIALTFNVSPLLVLQTDIDFGGISIEMLRPGWYVLAAGLAMAILNFVCARPVKPRGRGGRVSVPPKKERSREVERALAPVN